MKGVEEVIRYGSLKKGKIYRRDLLEGYIEKYRCMLIEAGAKRGILAKDYTDNCIVKEYYRKCKLKFSSGTNYSK